MPTTAIPGSARRLGVDLAGAAIGMPNLFSALPVAILAWVRASTSGLTRIATGAATPSRCATSESARELGLGLDVELADAGSSASRISPPVLPTPEKTIRSPGTPAARARRNSPSETTSMPAPSEAISAQHGEVGIGLHRDSRCTWSRPASASSNTR